MSTSAQCATSTAMSQPSIHQCCPADTLLYQAEEKIMEPFQLILPDPLQVVNGPLISIGPSSDPVLDLFGLGDTLLLKLHTLIGSICSSHWEVPLRLSPWNLTYEKASNLSQVLFADLQVPATTLVMQPKFSILTNVLKVLGITTLLLVLYFVKLMISQ
ncbi:hypothetical protein PAXRUDRAFT_162148 [Paxillus rubicundulus Ve08.2h10]|uniref:Uncharacterized protein n=1 Tax=Paxillus rubicundulus Ve08.2h10 TaxID=930991 RepID=A0A0D0D646_9AGAM|nr:hypothetical protein PAXRUDRAFT_162148 [Paxillus rubicundulus Ve08.2h10]